jgi:hypothetical protein
MKRIVLLENKVKRQKIIKPKMIVGLAKKKSLCVQYAEVLRLRQAIDQIQSRAKRSQDRRASE